MPKKRKKSSAYTVIVGITLLVAAYIYFTTNDLFVTLVLILLAAGIALSNR